MTRQERKSNGIAKRLVRAIADMENYDGDAVDVISDALVFAVREKKVVTEILQHFRSYYEEVSQ